MNWLTRIAAASGLAIALPLSAQAQEVHTLRLADQFPLTHFASKLSIQPFMEKVEERSEGRIKFQHFPAQQLAKGNGMLDAVKTGVADLALQVAGPVSDRIPLTTVVELPSIGADIIKCFNALEDLAAEQLFEAEYKALGVRAIEVGCTPSQYLVTMSEGVSTAEELQGLKVRTAGSSVGLMLNALGAVPVKMSGPDIYIALERGTLDGAAFAAQSSLGYKLETIVGGVARNMSFGSNAAILFMNEAKFQSLPEDLQQILIEVGQEVGADVAQAYNDGSIEALEKMAAAGVNVYDLPADALDAVEVAKASVAETWIGQMTERGLPGQEIFDMASEAVE